MVDRAQVDKGEVRDQEQTHKPCSSVYLEPSPQSIQTHKAQKHGPRSTEQQVLNAPSRALINATHLLHNT